MLTAHRARHVAGALGTIPVDMGEATGAAGGARGRCAGHAWPGWGTFAYRPVWRYAAVGWRRARAAACGPGVGSPAPSRAPRTVGVLCVLCSECGAHLARAQHLAHMRARILRPYGHAVRYLYPVRRCDGLPSILDLESLYVLGSDPIYIDIYVRSPNSAHG